MLRDLAIHRKLRLLVLLTCGLALLLAGIGIFAFDNLAFRQAMVRDLRLTARLIADNSILAMEFDRRADAHLLLGSLEVDPHIVEACLFDHEGRVFARYRRGSRGDFRPPPPVEQDGASFASGHLRLFHTVFVDGQRLGTIYLESDLEILDQRFRHLALIGLAIALISLLVSTLLAGRLQTMISAPLRNLARVVDSVAREGHFTQRVPAGGQDELGQLIAGFNRMLDQLQDRETALQAARAELERRVEDRTRQLQTSQELYASLVEALPMNVFRKDAEGRFTFCNQRFMAQLGRPLEDIIGHTDADLFPVELARQYRADDLVIMGSGRPFEAIESHSLPSGERTYVQVMKTPLRNGDGEVCGIQGIFWDVTDRKRAEEELAHERDLLRALLDSSPDDIYFKDTQSRFLKCSRALARRHGRQDPDEMVGLTDSDLFTEEHARPAFEDEQTILRTGVPIIGKEERETWANGPETWVATTKMPLRDRQGAIIGTFGVSRSITELKRAEARIEASHKQLLQASRQAGMAEVATGVLHNVGNVLNSVNVATTLLSEQLRKSKVQTLPKVVALLREHERDLGPFFTSDPRGRQLPGFLSQLTDHLLREHQEMLGETVGLKKNVDHIRDIVAMQQNYAKMAGMAEEVALADLAEDALRMNAGALHRHEVRVVREFGDVPPIVVEKHKVLQILVNLIRNAKYACDEGRAAHKTLTMRVWNGDGRVHVAVADNGVGIPPENLTRIFAHGFTTRKDGHGFGLHSAALAARELGGALRVESPGPGAGATFTLDLPLRPPHSKPPAPPRPPTATARQAPARPQATQPLPEPAACPP